MLSIIGGNHKNRLLKTPKTIRPTSAIVRKALFDICRAEVEGACFLDLYAGSGAMGLEALSRGAKEVTFVDRDPQSIKCIKHNVNELGVSAHSFVVCTDAIKALHLLTKKGALFDLIYVDPPYALETKGILTAVIDSNLLSPSGLLILEQKSSSPFAPPLSLHLLSTRTFGGTTLQIFEKLK
jgi:16S rRNA (guanine966-N2)-methyltransferase